MENKKDIIIRVLFGLIIVGILLIISIRKPNNVAPPAIENCKEDSLQKVITELQIELQGQEDGWDSKERRYEDILFEYEYGLEHLKHYHLEAYKDFHRIISHREYYSHEAERENEKRLQAPEKW